MIRMDPLEQDAQFDIGFLKPGAAAGPDTGWGAKRYTVTASSQHFVPCPRPCPSNIVFENHFAVVVHDQVRAAAPVSLRRSLSATIQAIASANSSGVLPASFPVLPSMT